MDDFLPTNVGGIPIHPLTVHAAVVLVPLVTVGFLALAVMPRWRSTYATLLALLSTAALGSAVVAKMTGEAFEEASEFGGDVALRVEEHAEWGERVPYAVTTLWVFSVALAVLARRNPDSKAMTAVVILGSVAAVAATGLAILAGHTGATAVWNPAGL